MPLVLSLRKGHGFQVGDIYVEVVSVTSPYEFSVRAGTCPVKAIGPDEWTPVAPGVELQAGVPQNQEGKIVRVAIKAPGMKIVRSGAKDPHSDCPVCHGTGHMKVKAPCDSCGGFGCHKCDNGSVVQTSKCQECH